jgi:hypothetical protein
MRCVQDQVHACAQGSSEQASRGSADYLKVLEEFSLSLTHVIVCLQRAVHHVLSLHELALERLDAAPRARVSRARPARQGSAAATAGHRKGHECAPVAAAPPAQHRFFEAVRGARTGAWRVPRALPASAPRPPRPRPCPCPFCRPFRLSAVRRARAQRACSRADASVIPARRSRRRQAHSAAGPGRVAGRAARSRV